MASPALFVFIFFRAGGGGGGEGAARPPHPIPPPSSARSIRQGKLASRHLIQPLLIPYNDTKHCYFLSYASDCKNLKVYDFVIRDFTYL